MPEYNVLSREGRRREKLALLESLRIMLECAGNAVEWSELEEQLAKLPTRALHNLKYRIMRALGDEATRET